MAGARPWLKMSQAFPVRKLEEVRSFYEVMNIRVNDEVEEKQRHVHIDVIEHRREKELSG
jgi:hypothetical protein